MQKKPRLHGRSRKFLSNKKSIFSAHNFVFLIVDVVVVIVRYILSCTVILPKMTLTLIVRFFEMFTRICYVSFSLAALSLSLSLVRLNLTAITPI